MIKYEDKVVIKIIIKLSPINSRFYFTIALKAKLCSCILCTAFYLPSFPQVVNILNIFTLRTIQKT